MLEDVVVPSVDVSPCNMAPSEVRNWCLIQGIIWSLRFRRNRLRHFSNNSLIVDSTVTCFFCGRWFVNYLMKEFTALAGSRVFNLRSLLLFYFDNFFYTYVPSSDGFLLDASPFSLTGSKRRMEEACCCRSCVIKHYLSSRHSASMSLLPLVRLTSTPQVPSLLPSERFVHLSF